MVALYLTLASVTAVYCLLGYWLAFGMQRWLWRAGAVCAALALLVPIRAYEPLVFFAMTSLLFVAVSSCRRLFLWWWEGRRKASSVATPAQEPEPRDRFQFRLHDLLGLMAVIGAGSWMARIVLREQVVMPWAGTAFFLAIVVTIAGTIMEVVAGKNRLLAVVGLILTVAVACGFLYVLPQLRAPWLHHLVGENLGFIFFGSSPHTLQGMLVLVLPFPFFIAIGSCAGRALNPTTKRRWSRVFWQGIGMALITTWVAYFVWLYPQLLSFPRPPSLDQLRANSFPQVLERGQAIESVSQAKAKGIATEVLSLAKQPGFVVVPWNGSLSQRKAFESDSLVSVQTCRSIGRGLQAQAVLVEKTNPDQAAEYHLGIIQLGDILEHEGLLIHGLVGMPIENSGQWGLVPLRSKVSSGEMRKLLVELQRIDEQRESTEVVMERDDLWRDMNERWGYRLYTVFVPRNANSSLQDAGYMQYQMSRERTCCCSRLLITDLAIRAYKADRGAFPDNLTELVPSYLKQIPNDLYTDQPPIYRREGEDFLLYSVGRDRKDEGGKFGRVINFAGGGGYDWSLEALTR